MSRHIVSWRGIAQYFHALACGEVCFADNHHELDFAELFVLENLNCVLHSVLPPKF